MVHSLHFKISIVRLKFTLSSDCSSDALYVSDKSPTIDGVDAEMYDAINLILEAASLIEYTSNDALVYLEKKNISKTRFCSSR